MLRDFDHCICCALRCFMIIFVSDEKLKDSLEVLVAQLHIDLSTPAHVAAARDTRSASTDLVSTSSSSSS